LIVLPLHWPKQHHIDNNIGSERFLADAKFDPFGVDLVKPKGDAMNTALASFTRAMLPLALWMALVPAAAQTPREQARKELARKVPAGSVQACSLITRADVKKATGRDPLVDAEPAGQGGWICNVGTGELKVYSGPKSWEAWESTLKGFKKDKEPQTPTSGFGERAYFLYPKPDNEHQGKLAFLVVKSGTHTLVLSLDAPKGKPAESMRPALETLMKLILARLS
jgi:hypothetical protein